MDMPKEEKSIDAVFLSHAHADHAQYIHFLRWDIPIYCTEPTQLILKSVQETGNSSFSGLIDACETFRYYINSKNTKSRIDRKKKEYIHERDFHIMEPYTRFKVGSMEIEMVPVDHSLPGACGFIVYTDEGNIVYTGDIRFHGSNGHLSHEFVSKAKKASPRWLLCEGTRIDSEIQDGEKAVCQQINEYIKKTQGLVFVEHPIRDIDRVNSIYQAALENGRKFAVPMKLAHLIETLGVHCPFSLDDVKILIHRKNWGLITKKDTESRLISQDYANWERGFLEKDNWISLDDVNKQLKST
jgi:ribonuclease J